MGGILGENKYIRMPIYIFRGICAHKKDLRIQSKIFYVRIGMIFVSTRGYNTCFSDYLDQHLSKFFVFAFLISFSQRTFISAAHTVIRIQKRSPFGLRFCIFPPDQPKRAVIRRICSSNAAICSDCRAITLSCSALTACNLATSSCST